MCNKTWRTRWARDLARTSILWSIGSGVGERVSVRGERASVLTAALIQMLRQSGASILCSFFGALDCPTLTFVLHTSRHRIISTARSRWVPLHRVGGIVCVLWRRGCIPTMVCPYPPSTGNRFRDCLYRPMVLVPSNDWDSRVIVNLSDLKRIVELSQHPICSPYETTFSFCLLVR